MSKPSVIAGQSSVAASRSAARALARIVDAELRGHNPRLVEQALSPLGRAEHVRAVERRVRLAEERGVSRAEVGAYIVGTRYLLTPESLAEELGRRGQP